MEFVEALRHAILYKGSNEFSKPELIGTIVLRLGLMNYMEAKNLIEEAIKRGIIEQKGDRLIIREEMLKKEEQQEDLFGEMINYIAKQLGWSHFEVLEELNKFSERYGELDKKVIAYLYGLDKGIDMSKFKDKLEV
ncbi:DUF2240 family protein [Thermococcus sibiricus]|uniref:DUF2240 family protein n=1 Tax=Thermococcus sibiricus (strain DSM 12597 / MM 739) TaxID=604354 RepID=C6A527_THESM|nr:DUF2240 family protein [Thermococcus sibiricus]ACS90722.1 hypothetical protein TSIB_1671 [Thermococcus sibiricus MM 739]